ncbi:MAG: YidC/Oxa1 family membrane protein insertase [Nitriliruptorales bacterium]
MIVWEWLLGLVRDSLAGLHDIFAFTGLHAWGWAIIGLTIAIRVLLLPLAVKQTRSMKAMQSLQPEVERIKKKYKVDRDQMKKKPEKYKAQKAKQNEELMALYKERGVNPAASCLPLLLQAPIFFALFRVLNDRGSELADADFYVFSPLGEAANTDVWGWVLIVLMVVSMFVTQRQMIARGAAAAGSQQATQQKIMMYVMPVFLAVVAQSLPIGVLIYWVTTNLWQVAQQAIIAYEVTHPDGETGGKKEGGQKSASGPTADGQGKAKPAEKPRQAPKPQPRPGAGPKRGARGGSTEHLPKRKRR